MRAAQVLPALAAASRAAGTGISVVASPRHRGVDIVLMDIEMPRLDGLAALAGMRAGGWAQPVIAVTGSAGAEEVENCAGRGRARAARGVVLVLI
jgi:two-component system capsular synthesis sensor histidine kinase RcsC